MWWIFAVLVLMVSAVSLYDFFVSRVWHEVTYADNDSQSLALKERHRRANILRKTYNRVMLVIVSGLMAVVASALVVNETFGGGGIPQPVPPVADTVQMTIEAPPLEPIATLPESYKLEGNAAVDQHAQREQQAEKGEVTPENPDNSAQPKNTTENTKTANNPTPPEKKPPNKKSNLSAADQALVDQAERQQNEARERARQRELKKEQQRLDELRRKQDGVKPTKENKQTTKSGTASVDWDHNWRKAYQDNDWYMRTPEYLCPTGTSGKVVVKVKVNANGDVTSATAIGNTSGVNPCLVENAVKYAYKSRFSTSSKSSDEGTVTYTYHP